jgi:hypothetical protein
MRASPKKPCYALEINTPASADIRLDGWLLVPLWLGINVWPPVRVMICSVKGLFIISALIFVSGVGFIVGVCPNTCSTRQLPNFWNKCH